MKKFILFNAPHPGEILAEFYLKPSGLTLAKASRKISISPSILKAITSRKKKITKEVAKKLSTAFNTTTNLWINLQANYDNSHGISN